MPIVVEAQNPLRMRGNVACSHVLGAVCGDGRSKSHISLCDHLLDFAGGGKCGYQRGTEDVKGRLYHHSTDGRDRILQSHGECQSVSVSLKALLWDASPPWSCGAPVLFL